MPFIFLLLLLLLPLSGCWWSDVSLEEPDRSRHEAKACDFHHKSGVPQHRKWCGGEMGRSPVYREWPAFSCNGLLRDCAAVKHLSLLSSLNYLHVSYCSKNAPATKLSTITLYAFLLPRIVRGSLMANSYAAIGSCHLLTCADC